ncbi:hypothetical protein AKO1_014648 [Acrasis kona]|uniref:Uncharacterized protein n=1 Tax=Acrasis kona TaxID=1008807 RepID=A0AAW2Z310_9EUKA
MISRFQRALRANSSVFQGFEKTSSSFKIQPLQAAKLMRHDNDKSALKNFDFENKADKDNFICRDQKTNSWGDI